MIYKIKALIRWMRYSLKFGVSYHPYGAGEAGSYLGWYEASGNCIAFRDGDGKVQFLW